MPFAHMTDPYGDMKALLARTDRIFPRSSQVTQRMMLMMGRFAIRNTVIEARTMGVWRLDPGMVPARPSIPAVHTKNTSRRWFVRKHTGMVTHMMESTDDEDGQLGMPQDTRLWFPSDEASKLLLAGKHDADLLFSSQMNQPTLPCNDELEEAGKFTLFSTPGPIKHGILYRDAVDILAQHGPLLARLCDEYARVICWMYGLTIDEFGEITHMYLTRHSHGLKTELLDTVDNGRYTGGPFVTVGIGRPHVYHDLVPILPASHACSVPVRVKIGEGVLLVLDGCAKTRYAHGHPETDDRSHYYTLNFQMDCMRRTLCTGVEEETHGLVTYTPVVPEHVVATSPDTPSPVAIRMESCPLWVLLLEMHTRLRVAESLLLTQGHKKQPISYSLSRGTGEKSSSSSIMTE
jgi:hypothetical protein